MALMNYTTDIDAWRTVSEIQQLLAKAGASHFSIKNQDSMPIAVSFTIDFNGRPLNFLLPCNIDGIKSHMESDLSARQRLVKAGKMKNKDVFTQHSLNVGWRIIKDWIHSQTALIEVNMAKMVEVFMPYLIINAKGETLAQKMLQGDGMKLLEF